MRETTGRDRPFPSSCRSAAERRLLNRREGDAPGKRRSAEIAHFYKRGLQEAHSVGMRDLGAAGAPEHRPPARRGRSARGPPDKTKKARAGRSPRGPARTRAKRKRPLLAGGVLLSHGLHRSTIGARGLNFRVRDGTGCASPAMAAGQQGAFSSAGPPVRALRAAQRSKASLQGRDRDRMPSPRRREGG